MRGGRRFLTTVGLGLVLLGLTHSAQSATSVTKPRLAWVNIWTGSKDDLDTWVMDMAVDTVGNVVLTGTDSADFVTVKVNGATGAQLWVARFATANTGIADDVQVALDAQGNVVITGTVLQDYATVKYDGATGDELWVAIHDPGDSVAGGVVVDDVLVDAAGDVVVTGAGSTIKYNGLTGAKIWTGETVWEDEGVFHGHVMALDASGNVVVAGYFRLGDFESDFTTVKYDGATGARLWAVRDGNVDGSANTARDLVVDSTGDVVVTGYFGGTELPNSSEPGDAADYVTIKYDGTTGDQLWMAEYDGPHHLQDVVGGIALDQQDNVLVTGSSITTVTADFATVKYDGETGAQVWAVRYDHPPRGGIESAYEIAVNAAGDVIVSGSDYTSYLTIKYDGTTGARKWLTQYNGPRGSIDEASCMRLDAAGNLIISGISYYGSYSSKVFATVKYLDPPPPALATFTLTPTTVTGGTKLTGELTITQPAGVRGTKVTFTTSDRRYRAPAAVTIPRGMTVPRKPLKYATRVVRTPVTYTVTATCGGVSQPIEVTLLPRQ